MAASTSCAVSPEAVLPGRVACLGWALACLLLGCWLAIGHGAAPPSANAQSTWQSDLHAAVALAQEEQKPLHVHFTQASAPLAARMSETLSAPPVAQLARLGLVNLRLDAGANAELFRRWLGGAGALGSCILDVSEPAEPDVVAVLPGFAETERYLEFLDTSRKSLARLRDLRLQAADSPAARLALGQLYAAQGSEARARSTFQAVPGHGVLRARALEQLARMDAAAGQVARARGELEQARSLAGDAHAWLFTEASLLTAERHVSQAAQLLEGALPTLAGGQDFAVALMLLGSLQHELGKDTAALTTFSRLKAEPAGGAMAREVQERIRHIERPEGGHTH